MSLTERSEGADRALAEAVASFWRGHRFAVAWTVGREGEDAKRVRESWPRTARAVAAEAGAAAGFVAGMLGRRNPVVVARPQDPEALPVFLVECDGEEDVRTWEAFGAPATLEARSSGEWKRHYYYRPPGGAAALKMSARFEGGTLNLLGNAYLVTPPAVHPSGVTYRFVERSAEIAELPRGVYDALLAASGERDRRERERLEGDPGEKITAGGRHRRLLSLAGALRRQGVSIETGLETLLRFNGERCDPPKSRDEVEALVRDVWGRYDEAEEPAFDVDLDVPAPPAPRRVEQAPRVSDDGFADHLVRLHCDSVRYEPDEETWFVWSPDAGVWSRDGKGRGMVEEAVTVMIRDATRDYGPLCESDEHREALEKVSGARVTRTFREHVMSIAKNRLWADGADFDAQRWLLNVGNGCLDLRELRLRERRQADRLTREIPTPYDPAAGCPRWRAHVDFVTRGDAEYAAYLQRLCGLLLTGHDGEQKFFIWWGEGGNGKGVTFDVMSRLLTSNYAAEIGYASLVEQHREGSRATPDWVRTRWARMIVCDEAESAIRLNEARVKHLTGGGVQTARDLYSKQVTWRSQAKLILITNRKPTLAVTDAAMRRRVVFVPFLARVSDGERVDNLSKLIHEEEAAGVLAWCVDGLRRYLRDGLGTCAAVEEATSEFLREGNPAAPFLDEMCIAEAGATYRGDDLRHDFNDFLDGRGERRMSDADVTAAFEALGFRKERRRDGGAKVRVWVGLRPRGGAV